MEALILVATKGGPTMLARIGMLRDFFSGFDRTTNAVRLVSYLLQRFASPRPWYVSKGSPASSSY